MYTLFSEKKVPSVKKEDEPENLASKLRGNWMFGINPTSNKDKLPLGGGRTPKLILRGHYHSDTNIKDSPPYPACTHTHTKL